VIRISRPFAIFMLVFVSLAGLAFAKTNTTTKVTSSLNPSTYGSSVKFTATVTPSAATGTVTFKDGTKTLGTASLSAGTASYSTTTLTAGTHSITASYAGNTTYNTSTSSALSQTVNKVNSTTTVASSVNPSIYGSSVKFTATVTPSAATGTVTFKDGTKTLGTGTISGGTASYSTSTLAVGSHSITASYAGDSNDNSSTSTTLTQNVLQSSSVSLTSSANPSIYGASVTFTATVSPSAATGTVTFYNGTNPLGTGSISGGIATYPTSALPAGSDAITAVYAGNSTYASSTSPVLTQSVLTITAISVTPAPLSLPIAATQQFTATGTYSNGTQGNITTSVTWSSSATNVATISSAGNATGAGQGTTTIQAAVGTVIGSASLTGTPSPFIFTGSLNTPRAYHTATLLQNGQVLITGGSAGGSTFLGSCELYNPATGTFTYTGNLLIPRAWHTATLLQNGQVLIAGGEAYSNGSGYKPLPAEIYNPATGYFSYTGSLNTARTNYTATLLQNGQVLLAGGSNDATAELYDPTAGTFTYTTGNMTTIVGFQSSTLLNDGTVLIAGGSGFSGSTAGAELYNPTSKTFSATGSLNSPRDTHTATLLSNGNVLIATGENKGTYLTTAELYNPTAKTFTVTGSLANPRLNSSANLLSSGNVLIAGGFAPSGLNVAAAELYNPTGGTFSLAGNLNIPRGFHASALLNNGTVLIAGGWDQYLDQYGDYALENVPQAEIYQPVGTDIAPVSLQITPATANVLVGGTQTFTAIDSNGNPRQDASWTVSNPSFASVTTNANGTATLTGIAVGQVTLTATTGTTTAQEQVNILGAGSYPSGTVVWSAPPTPGFSPIQLVQATPTAGGPDLYSTQLSSDGTKSILQALTADGEQLWQTALPPLDNNSVPDGFGGVIVTEYDTCVPGQTNPMTVVDLDPIFGQPTFQIAAAGVQVGNTIQYCYTPGPTSPKIAVRGDGAVILSGPSNNGFPRLTLVPVGGANIVSYYIPPTILTNTDGSQTAVQCCMGPPMVNSDGTAYVEYEVRNVNANNVITSDTLYLFQINPDSFNSSSSTLLSSTTQNEALLPGSIIPDGQGGVLATWTISPSNPPVPQYPYQVVDVSAGAVGTPYSLPFSPTTVTFGQFPSLVLGENGFAFATDGTNSNTGPQVVSFNVASGAVNWSYQTVASNTLSIIAAAHGNGVTAKLTQNGADTVVRLDSNGNPSYDSWASGTVSSIDFFVAGNSWIGAISGAGSYGVISAAPIPLSTSGWYRPDGNGGKTAKADVIVTGFSQGPDSKYSAITSVLQAIQTALPSYASCNNWLQGTISGLQEIQNLLNPQSGLGYGHGTVNLGTTVQYSTAYTIGAFSGSSNSDGKAVQGLPESGVILTVNDVGAFFNQTYSSNGTTYTLLVGQPKYSGNSPQARATILIHELAHQIAVPGFQPDFNDPKGEIHKANDQLVNQNCNALITAQ
jgi:hypothetical protein